MIKTPIAKRRTKTARATHTVPSIPSDSKPSEPVLALTTPVERCLIFIEGVGETISDIPGSYTVAKRLAMAYQAITGQFVAGDIFEAFEIIQSSASSLEIHARLKPQSSIIRVPLVDPRFVASTERQPLAVAAPPASNVPRFQRTSYRAVG